MQLRLEYPHRGTYPIYEHVLKLLIGEPMEQKSLLDLCSRESPFIQHYPLKEKVYVDATNDFVPPKNGTFHHLDLFDDHPIFKRRYNVVTCLDGIEHLSKFQGYQLLTRMESMSDTQILFTPLGEHMVEPESTDPKTHKCGWWPDDLMGYASIVFPNYHGHFGAFFFWRCPNLEENFMQISTKLGDMLQFKDA